jgi:hypothetical protein
MNPSEAIGAADQRPGALGNKPFALCTMVPP